MSPKPTDAEVFEASIDDIEAFAIIVERYHVDILHFVTRLASRSEAQDLTSEVLARAFQNRGKYDKAIPSARSWLLAIAANVTIDHLRRQQMRHRRRGAEARTFAREYDPSSDVVDKVVAQSIRPALIAALQHLRPDDQVVLLMTAWGGLKQTEIAQALDVPVGTVKSRLSRARAKILEQVPDLASILEQL